MSYLSQSDLQARRVAERKRIRRRRMTVLGVLVSVAVIVAIVLAATGQSGPRATTAHHRVSGASAVHVVARRSAPRLPPIAPAAPGVAHVFTQGPPKPEIALTFDDGICAQCVARILHTLAVTGTHATIFPNGVYSRSWDPQAATIRRLVAAHQLQVGNHTFLHHDPLLESPATFQADLNNDEAWIERTFGVTARPFFRPPYGAYNASTLAAAGQLGYTKVITWSGTVADSSPRTIGYLLGAIRHWAKPGAIILMHGNYPPTSFALPQIFQILKQRGLRPVTLSELLG